MEKVLEFLTSIDLQDLYIKFKEQEITMDDLLEMTPDDLKDMKINMGPRKRIEKALSERKASRDNANKNIRQEIEDLTRINSNGNESWSPPCDKHYGKENRELEQKSKSNTSGNATSEVSSIMEKVSNLKTKSKNSLCTIYEDIRQLFNSQSIFEELKNEMMAEFGYNIIGIITDFEEDIVNDSCPIVITGETSAGKSTFVNLLLGLELMPQSSLSCTSTICRISNSPRKAVFLTDSKNNRKQLHNFDVNPIDNVAIKELLKEYLCKRSTKQATNEPKEEYKYVDIFWPLPSLKGNVMIVDTPGIGPDDPELTKRLFAYLPQALAFIYILNTPNAGGVQSDRILQIQAELGKQKDLDPHKQFDPQRAIFICNKWDQIHEDPDEVFTTIQSLLEENWTGFKADQLFKLSARQDMVDFSKGKPISDDFKQVLRGIENMIPLTAEEKIRRHLRWQYNFIERMRVKLSARIRNTLKSKEEKTGLLKETKRRIEKIKQESEAIKKRIEDQASQKGKQIIHEIFLHLNNESTKNAMFSWSEEELPDLPNMDKIDESIEGAIRNRVNKEMRRKLNKEVLVLTEHLRGLFNTELYKIGTEFGEIDQIILGEHEALLAVREKDDKKEFLYTLDGFDLSRTETIILAATTPLTVPLFLLGGVIATVLALPVGIGVMVKDKLKNKNRIEKYKKDKREYARKMGQKYLETIKQDRLFNEIGTVLIENAKLRIGEYFVKVIPKRIAAGQALIENITKDLRAPRVIREQCHNTERGILPVYGRIMLAYNEIFGEKLISKECVKNSQAYEGSCEIELDRGWTLAAVIQQKCGINTEIGRVTLGELSILRKCQHPNLVTIYGMSSFDGFAIYMEKCDTTLETQVIVDRLKWEMCRKYLNDILEGLKHLHNHGLVHQNIRLGNIQIKKGRAKLSGGGITEVENLKGKIEGIPIIRAPEVLENRYCGYEADMFQFGVVLWECWYMKRAFWENGKPAEPTYEDLYLAIINGKRPFFPQPKPDSKLYSMIENCWQPNPDARPSAQDVQDYIRM